jgi:hypothetical protein
MRRTSHQLTQLTGTSSFLGRSILILGVTDYLDNVIALARVGGGDFIQACQRSLNKLDWFTPSH